MFDLAFNVVECGRAFAAFVDVIERRRAGCATAAACPWRPQFTFASQAQQPGHRLAMPDGQRRPDDCRHRPVVSDERGDGHLLGIDLNDDLGGQEPRGRLEPDPVVVAITDLPPAHVVQRGPPLETQAEDYSPDELPREPRGVFDRCTRPLLRRPVRGGNRRDREEVDVVGFGQGAEGADRLGNVALSKDGRRRSTRRWSNRDGRRSG